MYTKLQFPILISKAVFMSTTIICFAEFSAKRSAHKIISSQLIGVFLGAESEGGEVMSFLLTNCMKIGAHGLREM